MPFKPLRQAPAFAAVICLLAILAAELVQSVRVESQTSDEAFHLLAGYRYWRSQDFGINPEHPPLVKLLASFPLLFSRPEVPASAAERTDFPAGRAFLYANDADSLLFKARIATSVFTLLLALLVFQATNAAFGRGAAFFALGLLVFEPNLLGHGALVTMDMALTCCFFASVSAFYLYVKKPAVLRLAGCGVATGLALAAKHPGLLVIPTLGLLGLAELLITPRSGPPPAGNSVPGVESIQRRGARLAVALVLIGMIALLLLWGLYGFRFQARPDGLEMSPPLGAFLAEGGLESRMIRALAHWRLLPEAYLYGLAFQLTRGAHPMFLFGKLYPHSRWFYFPATFLIKSTLGFLLLLSLIPAGAALRRPGFRREIVFLTLPPGLYLAVSLTADLDTGVRLILPVYPFLLVLAATGAWSLAKQQRRWAYAVGVLTMFHIFSSVRSFPNYLAYSNELWGGPAKTYKVLTDSNVDWGQGLKAAKHYLDRRHIADCWFAYFGPVDPAYYHIPCKLLPSSSAATWGRELEAIPPLIEGAVLVSATEISGQPWGPGELNPYERFLGTRPVDSIGGSILVFRGRFDVSRASALSRLWKVRELADRNQFPQALEEARAAAALAPRCVDTQYVLGRVLKIMQRPAEARRAFETALKLAQTVYPEYQRYWLPYLQRELFEP